MRVATPGTGGAGRPGGRKGGCRHSKGRGVLSESHRMQVVAEAKHKRKAIVWEIIGLLVVLAAGAAALTLVVSAIIAKSGELAAAKEKMAAEAKPEFAAVDVQTVKVETVRDSIRLPGLVFANLAVKTPVEVAGRVAERVAENGRAVKKGDVLLRIDPRDYQVRMRRAEAALNLARLQHERTKNLAGQRAVSIAELDAIENELERAAADYEDARLALERCEVRAPIDGDVAFITPEAGEWLESGAIVAEIVDIATIKVKVGIAERDLAAVRSLETCEMTADSVRGGYAFTGRKTYLSLTPAENTQVYILELEADNRERLLSPGMFVEADVVRAVRNHSMMAMAFAVMTTASSTYEVAVVEDVREAPSEAVAADGSPLPPERFGVARRVPVELGVMRGSEVEILLNGRDGRGLRPGDLLVVNGQRGLDDGAPVRIRRRLESIREIER